MKEIFFNKLNSGLPALGVSLDTDQLEKLYRYYELVIEKNKVMNLTAITEVGEFADKHIIDSLSIVRAGSTVTELLNKDSRVLDLGTGAGLPGMVLKIAFPDIRICLADSLRKRIDFLNECIAELGLTGVDTVHGRAEDLGHDPKYREKFDLTVSRAVADMRVLSEYCLPFSKLNGYFCAYKSGDSKEEIASADKAFKVLGGSVFSQSEFVLPGTDMGRNIVIVKKVRSTPGKYPRKAGTPHKEPIGNA